MNELGEPWKSAAALRGLTSFTAIAGRSGASVQTVIMVLSGKRRPSPATAEKLAAALGVPKSRIDEWTGRKGTDVDAPYRPPEHADRLTARQRKAVDELIMAMVDPRAAPASELGSVGESASATDQYRLAARHGMDEDRKKR